MPGSETSLGAGESPVWKPDATAILFVERTGGDNGSNPTFEIKLMNPDGYYTQHRPEMITREDYLSGRWIAKPANIYDNDLPIQVALAVVFTTPERAKAHKPKPAYVLSHGQTRPELQGVQPTL